MQSTIDEAGNIQILDEDSVLHTEEMQEIIASPPAWLIRWGIGIFLLVITSVFLLTIFIGYPETIRTNLIVNSNERHSRLLPHMDGVLKSIEVKSGQAVRAQQVVALIESDADHKEVAALEVNLLALENYLIRSGVNQPLFTNIEPGRLGSLQEAYQRFILNYTINQKAIIQKRFENLTSIIAEMSSLTKDIRSWKSRYEIVAPQSGTVNFIDGLGQTSKLFANQPIAEVVSGKSFLWGEIHLSLTQKRKVKKGQKVILKQEQFSGSRPEIIEGIVSSISSWPQYKGLYTCKVYFDEKRQSNLKNAFNEGMSVSAAIVTGEASLFDRVTKNLF